MDKWDLPDFLYLWLDSIQVQSFSPMTFPNVGSKCGNGVDTEGILDFTFLFQPHSSDNLLVHFITLSDENALTEAWGFREFSLKLKLCDDSCASCSGPATIDCTSCMDNYYFSGGYCIPCNQGYFMVGQQCLPCHISCGECFRSSKENCLNCHPPDTIMGNTCVSPTSILYDRVKKIIIYTKFTIFLSIIFYQYPRCL